MGVRYPSAVFELFSNKNAPMRGCGAERDELVRYVRERCVNSGLGDARGGGDCQHLSYKLHQLRVSP